MTREEWSGPPSDTELRTPVERTAPDIEFREGPRYVEAIRGAREMRKRDFFRWGDYPIRGASAHQTDERALGIPEGWITR